MPSFICAVAYCCDIWPQRSHILAPLTDLSGKGTFNIEYCKSTGLETFKQTCDICYCTKIPWWDYNHLPPWDALIAPWFEEAIDLIRPWQITIGSQILSFEALTCNHTVTNLAEVICSSNKLSGQISMLLIITG